MITKAFSISANTAAASAPRQHAARMADALGFAEARAGQVALVVSELATNIAKHAHDGWLLIQEIVAHGVRGVEVLALDKGPGVPQYALRDGFSTAGSLGTGLGAIRRQADQFDIFTQQGVGTIAVARVWSESRKAPAAPSVTGISVPMAGQTVSGDAWGAHSDARRQVFIVVDGLGHGPQAAEAAAEAMRIFEQKSAIAPVELIEEVHLALRATRGAAVAVASIDTERDVLRYAGVGNIVASLVTPGSARQSLASHNGTAGHAMRRLQEFTYPVRPGATLVMHSDGLGTQWNPQTYTGVWGRDPALAAGALYRDFTRGRDDATIVVAQIGAREAVNREP